MQSVKIACAKWALALTLGASVTSLTRSTDRPIYRQQSHLPQRFHIRRQKTLELTGSLRPVAKYRLKNRSNLHNICQYLKVSRLFFGKLNPLCLDWFWSITNPRFSRCQSVSVPRSAAVNASPAKMWLQPAPAALAALLAAAYMTSEVGGAIDGSTGDFLNIPDRDHA